MEVIIPSQMVQNTYGMEFGEHGQQKESVLEKYL